LISYFYKNNLGAQRFNMLNAIPLFHNFSDMQLQSVGAHLALRVFDKGALILSEGERGDAMYVVVSGQVKVFSIDADDSSREVILKVLGAGEFFGELPVFDNEPRSASVAALERCRYCRIALFNVPLNLPLILPKRCSRRSPVDCALQTAKLATLRYLAYLGVFHACCWS
jgi:signal-transduction protein with cAMP-binding, CBS, and nucleotidyltransferase domain